MTRVSFFSSDYTITGFGWAEVRSCPRLTQGAAAGHHIIYYYYTHTFLTWVEILFSIGSYLGYFFGFHFFACIIIIIIQESIISHQKNFIKKSHEVVVYYFCRSAQNLKRPLPLYCGGWLNFCRPSARSRQQEQAAAEGATLPYRSSALPDVLLLLLLVLLMLWFLIATAITKCICCYASWSSPHCNRRHHQQRPRGLQVALLRSHT